MRSMLASVLVVAACASSSTSSAAPATEGTVRVTSGTGGMTQIRTTAVGEARTGVIETSIDRIWAALPEAYASLGIELARIDRSTGIVGNPGFRARRRLGATPISRYVDCGRAQGTPSADTYEVHFSVITEVSSEDPGRTTVTTRVDATARPVNFTADSVRCTSHGELENRIFVALVAATAG